MNFTGEIETAAPGERDCMRFSVRVRLPWWSDIALNALVAWCWVKTWFVDIDPDAEAKRFGDLIERNLTVTVDDVAV